MLPRTRSPDLLHLVTVALLIMFMVSNGEGLPNDARPWMSSQTGTNCSKAVSLVLEEAYSGATWALEMVDACAKPQTGMLRQGLRFAQLGEIVPMNATRMLGNFDQCMDLNTKQQFGTIYCTAEIDIQTLGRVNLTSPKNVFVDVCVPDVCTGDDLVAELQHYSHQIPGITATVKDIKCRTRETPALETTGVVVICFLSFFTALAIVATVYDIVFIQGASTVFLEKEDDQISTNAITITSAKSITATTNSVTTNGTNGLHPLHSGNYSAEMKETRNDSQTDLDQCKAMQGSPSILGQLLLPFSLYTNCSKLMSTSESRDSIGCINGVRVLTMIVIVMGHNHFFGDPVMENARPSMNAMKSHWSAILLHYNSVPVDTFFVISGLLITQNTLKKFMTLKPSLRYFLKDHYFHRYLRITPPYMAILMTYAFLFIYVGNGPFLPWEGSEVDDRINRHSWWTNVLYINTITNRHDMVMKWAWYISNEMQYFMISPITLLALYRYGRRGLCVPLFIMAACCSFTGFTSYVHNISPMLVLSGDVTAYVTWYRKNYFMPVTHLSSYLVGMIAGYFLHETGRKVNMSKTVAALGWIVSTAMAALALATVYIHVNVRPFTNGEAALYNAIHRSLWSVYVAWVIFACACGYGGILNKILRWKVFIPIARVSYCTYMLHVLVMKVFFWSQRRMIYATLLSISINFLGILIVSLLLAALTYLVFEAPFSNLEKAIGDIRRANEKKKRNVKLHQN